MNSLQLAPYNESMRLGQGYNSFLQRPCVYGAVKVDANRIVVQKAVSNNGVPQIVSYSSRVVTKISEVTRTMNISAGSSIKSGSITVSGNQSAFDEAKFVSSDLNVVISVKVINQTAAIDAKSEFHEINGIELNEEKGIKTNEDLHDLFNRVYGDRFIQGGEFHSVVSIRVLDGTQKEKIVSNLKSKLTVADPKSFSLQTADKSQSFASEMKQTESSIYVNWSGGGQIKSEDEQWSLDSIFRAAAAFPNKVATSPQLCWAILTQYSHNLTFLRMSLGKSVFPHIPNYMNARQYAEDLLDAFVGYRSNLLHIKKVLDDPTAYVLGSGYPPVDVRAQALVKAQASMKEEINKIITCIDELYKKPSDAAGTVARGKIEAPEIWATRLPALKATGKLILAGGELAAPSEDVINTLKMFGFMNENATTVAENLFRKMWTERSTDYSKIAPLATKEVLKVMNESEKTFVNSDKARRKFGGKYLYDTPCGAPGEDMNFNDAEKIESASVQADWPKSLDVRTVSLGGKEVLGLCKLQYQRLILPHPEIESRVALYYPDQHLFKLEPGERIQEVKIGYLKPPFGANEINFIDITVQNIDKKTPGAHKMIGTDLNDEAKNPSVVCKVSGEFTGLKGFYGHQDKDRITRLGVIWGK
ncbi:hypothetical protein CTheo_6244 [Ceratobasidium theobromae]|uniref:MACPF domain-containing protein n=1 Tax=Ceratobasidium theobromae TaxID=1582974 RepID=A0A5N5QFS9_9AGAM|nr:hypothetical protein CTheo_6244 [Ceratobasidium theobromae]